MLVELVPPTRASLLIHIQVLPAGATLPIEMCTRTPQTWEPPHLGIKLKLDEILVYNTRAQCKCLIKYLIEVDTQGWAISSRRKMWYQKPHRSSGIQKLPEWVLDSKTGRKTAHI